jgi:hypothetical protein
MATVETKPLHFVTFRSPGTFVAEETAKPIGEWDPREAMRIASGIKERYGAIPYGFQFSTWECADLGDGELPRRLKELKRSAHYYINGKVETLAEVEARSDPKERTLLLNMQGNGYARIVTTTNGYRWTQPFEDGDIVVNAEGEEQPVPEAR